MAIKPQSGNPDPFTSPQVHRMIEGALAEDVGRGDITSAATLALGARGRASLVARESAVVAGLPLARAIFDQIAGGGDSVQIKVKTPDGSKVASGSNRHYGEADADALIGISIEQGTVDVPAYSVEIESSMPPKPTQ